MLKRLHLSLMGILLCGEQYLYGYQKQYRSQALIFWDIHPGRVEDPLYVIDRVVPVAPESEFMIREITNASKWSKIMSVKDEESPVESGQYGEGGRGKVLPVNPFRVFGCKGEARRDSPFYAWSLIRITTKSLPVCGSNILGVI